MKSWIQDYITAQHAALDSISQPTVEKLITTLQTAWREDRQVFIVGNGGSASNASHFATDLGKGSSDKLGKRFRVLSLTDNISWITALGNDYAYEEIFSRQLANYGRPGDLLLAISVSGNSPNIVKATEWANANGMETAALVGAKRGRLAEIAHQVLVVGDTHYGRVEDVQMHVLHMLCYAFMELPELAVG
jgi:D-sedoheptulose 7-phosphate isomerase